MSTAPAPERSSGIGRFSAAGIGPLVIALGAFFLLGMRQRFTVPGTFGLSLGQLLLFVCGAAWAFSHLLGGRHRLPPRALTIAILGYLIASLVSYAITFDNGVPHNAFEFGDRYIFGDLVLTAMTFGIIAVVDSIDRVVTVLKGLLLGGALSATFAILRLFAGIDLSPLFRLPGLKADYSVLVTNLAREGIDRPQGSAGHPLELAAVLTVLIPIGMGVVAVARARGQRTWPWALCTAVLICGAAVTISRSAVVGLIAAILVMAWRWSIQRFVAVLMTGLAAVGLGYLMQLQVVAAITQAFATASNDSSIASRGLGAEYVTTHFRENFWFGQGTGMYPAFRQPVLDNSYLTRLMETGVVGLVGYVILIGVALALALRASAAACPVTAEIAGSVSGSLAALAVCGVILDLMGFVQIWYLLWILIALSGVLWHLSRADTTASVSAEAVTAREVGC